MDTTREAAIHPASDPDADALYDRAQAAADRGAWSEAATLFAAAEARYESSALTDQVVCARFEKEQCWARSRDPRAHCLPARVPASAEETREILDLHRWFSKFSPYDQLRIGFREGRMARLFQDMARGRRVQ